MTTETTQTAAPPQDAPAPPAYFLSLTVKNFRCFGPAQTLDLSRGGNRPAPWTIILGENGVGKTTLLQCLAALQPQARDFPKQDQESGFTYESGPIYEPSISSLLALGFSGQNKERRRVSSAKISCDSCIGSDLGMSEGRLQKLNGKLEITGYGNYFPQRSFTRRNLSGLICYGYGASRRMGKASLSEQRTDDTTASLFSDDVDLINAEEWLLQADYAASRAPMDSTRAAQRRDQVREILTELLPDVEEIRISTSEERIGTSLVEFRTPYGWVRLKDLSLGYRTLLTWMVDLASRLFDRYPKSANPLAEPAVVLVDEIDLHLHPRWQRKLMGFLSERFPNTQFIATAHSPLVVQAAQDANIVLLRREGDHVVIDNDVERIPNWRVDQVLTSELFGLESARPPQVSPALEERKKILAKSRLTKRTRSGWPSWKRRSGTCRPEKRRKTCRRWTSSGARRPCWKCSRATRVDQNHETGGPERAVRARADEAGETLRRL